MCNYKKQFLIFVLFASVVTSTFGRRSGGGSRSRGGGSKSTSHSTSHIGTSHTGTSHYGTSSHPLSSGGGASYPRQTYNTGTGSSNTNYGWKTNTGANKYNSNTGSGHYYNSPSASSSTNWGSSYNSPSYHPPQNAFGTFQPVSSGIAPSYHFHRSTSYVPIYIPSSHTYIHRHHTTDTDHSSTSANNNPPPLPPSEPVVYKEDSSSLGEGSKPTMIVGFNNMIVYGVFESEKHYVITISEDLDDDIDNVPEHFLRTEESSLFDIVTLKPTTTTTTTTTTETAPIINNTTMTSETSTLSEIFGVGIDDWTANWRSASKDSAMIDKDAIERKISQPDNGDRTHTSDAAKVDDDALNMYFGEMIL